MIAASSTSTLPTPAGRATSQAIDPSRRAPSESAATPETATSTGSPGGERLVQGRRGDRLDGDDRGRPSSAVATPDISPPPPTATSTVSTPRPASSSCSISSRPSVPAPAQISGWS